MAALRVLGTSWCSDTVRARAFLDEHHIDYEWTDIDVDERGASEVESWHDGQRVVPTIVFDDGTMLSEPSNEELAAKLDIH